jgi:hypothetical protein
MNLTKKLFSTSVIVSEYKLVQKLCKVIGFFLPNPEPILHFQIPKAKQYHLHLLSPKPGIHSYSFLFVSWEN